MLSCFVCKLIMYSVNEYILHLRIKHSVAYQKSQFSCNFTDCLREFSNIENFRKHLQKHVAIEKNSSVGHCSKDSDTEVLETESNNSEEFEQINEIINKISNSAAQTSKSDFKNEFLKLTLKFLSDEALPRNKALSMIKMVYSTFRSLLLNLKDKFEQCMAEVPQNIQFLDDFTIVLNEICDIDPIKSEYLIFKELEKIGVLILPKRNLLSSHSNIRHRNNTEVLNVTEITAEVIPLRLVLQKLFNVKDIFQSVLKYMEEIKVNVKDNFIGNSIQGSYWTNLVSDITSPAETNILYLPLFLFGDDFEPLNALGAHAGAYKVGAIYIKIPCLPSDMQSKLKYILLAMLYFSEDKKKYGNSAIFWPLIEELKYIRETGIMVTGVGIIIKFVTVILLGDNLGVHSILGFTESFNAKHYCIFCTSSKAIMEYQTIEDSNLLRTKENYDRDVLKNDVSETGINESSVFNKLQNFHVVENAGVDIMHDLLEGVFHYDICQTFSNFTKSKIITIDLLNQRILKHNFGHHTSNRPGPITEVMIAKNKLKYTAEEMHIFMINLPLLIADLIPENKKEWHLYLLLRDIFSIVNARVVHKESCELLRDLIQQHHLLYIELFGALKPKHHFMVHYPRLISKFGPLCDLSSIRFEAKHQVFTKIAHAITSRRNLIHSFALKHQLGLANTILNFEDPAKNILIEGVIEKLINVDNLIKTYKINEYIEEMYGVSWVKHFNIKFKPNDIIQFSTFDDEIPAFCAINKIVKYNNKHVFCCQEFSDAGYRRHYYAYEVELSNSFLAIDFCAIFNKKNYHMHRIHNMNLINCD